MSAARLRKLSSLAVAWFGLWQAPSVATAIVFYVDDDAPLGGDGAGWGTAFSYLQDALYAAAAGDEIRVAGGNYLPDRDEAGIATPGAKTSSFVIPDGVRLQGGYAGHASPDAPNRRSVAAFETVLSGDLNGDDGDDLVGTGENVWNVVTASFTGSDTLIDGVTIFGGNARDPAGFFRFGGGVYVRTGSPTFVDVTFYRNQADYGAALYNYQASSPRVTRCRFLENYASNRGAIGNFFNCQPLIEMCRFDGNYALLSGAGLHNHISKPTVLNCTFSGNVCDGVGAAITNYDNSDLTAINCTFSNNTAADGRALACDSQPASPSNRMSVVNSVFADGGDEIWNDDESDIQVTFSLVQGGYPGFGNVDVAPLLVDPLGIDGIAGTADDNLRLQGASPAVNAGKPGIAPDAGPIDFDGHRRVLCGNIDMGAFEFGLGDADCNREVNLADLAFFASCLSGPGGDGYPPHCGAFDATVDDDIDAADFAALQVILGSL